MLSFSPLTSRKYTYNLLAWVCLFLAIGGAILPLLPSTPFLLSSVFFSSKGDAKLVRWLIEHPRFGPAIQHWQKERSISRTNKFLATLMILVNWTVLAVINTHLILFILLSVLFLLVTIFIIRLPTEKQNGNVLFTN